MVVQLDVEEIVQTVQVIVQEYVLDVKIGAEILASMDVLEVVQAVKAPVMAAVLVVATAKINMVLLIGKNAMKSI